MEYRKDTLSSQPFMKNNKSRINPKQSVSPEKVELATANARIKKLEKQLARSEDILKS